MGGLTLVRSVDRAFRVVVGAIVLASLGGVGMLGVQGLTPAHGVGPCSATTRNTTDCTVAANSSLQFSPQTISVVPGVTVTWTNTSAFAHNVSSDAGAAESFGGNPAGDLPNNGSTYSHKFQTIGTDGYSCRFHASSGMVGTVNVVDPTAAPYLALKVRSSHGSTVMHWTSAYKVLGYNVFSKGHRLNRGLVTSQTLRYTFRFHAIVHHPHLRAVPYR